MTTRQGPADGAGPNENRAGDGHRRWPAHIVVPVIVAVVIGAVLLVSARQVLRPAEPVEVRPVLFAGTAAAGEPDDAPRGRGTTVQAPGWLEADPFYVACTALADGIVEEMLVLAGHRVEAGDVVARLVSEDAELALARAEADLATAEAELAVVEAEVQAARTNWENPVERQRAVGVWRAAHAGTEAELAQLPALIDVEQANLERLREELARARQARERGGATEIEVIILDKQVAAQAATIESIRRSEAILTAQRDRRHAEVAAAERNFELRVDERWALDAAEAAAQRARAAVAQARVRRDEAQLRLDRMVIRAPISGFVQRRLKVPGDKIMLAMDDPYSAHLAHLYDPKRLQVRVDVPLADAAGVFVGQACEVVVEILPDVTFTGEVTRITHEADLQKNTLQVKVRVIDPSPLLKPEMLTRVKFLGRGGQPRAGANTTTTGPALLVPTECLSRDADTSNARLWVIRDRRGRRGICLPLDVVVEAEADGWATIRGALAPGDLVAVADVTLRPGQPVRMRLPDAERGGAS
ncbi:MAG: efflux RND transporter periplasmic adaptor subunit [Planctomycetota bacterium]